MMKLNKKEMTGLACIVAGVAALSIIPMCCCRPCAKQKFIRGGRAMLEAIPEMAEKCGRRIIRKVIF